jgi:hypothetical protein
MGALLDSLTGGAGASADSRAQEFPADDTQLNVSYRVTSIVGNGRDELTSVYDPDAVIPGDTYVPPTGPPLGGVVYTSRGQRVVTMTVKVECGFQAAGANAHYYAERIRTRIKLPSARRALKAMGLAINEILPSHDFAGSSFANREDSVSFLEVILNATDSAQDEPVTTIEQVIIDPPVLGD